jgi:hypothetical protein
MTAWAEFANADPELAAFGRERIEGRVVFHATVRLDGSPRVHPVSPWFGAGLLAVSCRLGSPKVEEFSRDGGYALHTAIPADDHAGAAGEFLLRGWMERLADDHPAVNARPYGASYPLATYACSVDEAVATTYEGDEVIYRRWRP